MYVYCMYIPNLFSLSIYLSMYLSVYLSICLSVISVIYNLLIEMIYVYILHDTWPKLASKNELEKEPPQLNTFIQLNPNIQT